MSFLLVRIAKQRSANAIPMYVHECDHKHGHNDHHVQFLL